jgi:pyruvate formate lyase activating enzyme
MSDSSLKKWSRRKVIQAGTCGICALSLGGLGGLQALAQSSPGAGAAPQKGLLKPKQSAWFSQLAEGRIKCVLCPHACELEPGERARCRVRENRQGQGYTLVYGNPALVREDPVERLPFFHVLPGSRTLAVSTAGCNLSCKFCEVWDMALVDPEELHAYDLPAQNLLMLAKDSGLSSISFAFGEPVVFYEYLARAAALAREQGLLNLMHTAAYIRPEPLLEIIPYLDAVNVDLKGFETEFYQETVGGKLDPVLRSLEILRSQGVHLEITNTLLPALNDDKQTIGRMCEWIARQLGPEVPLHLARFYPLYKLSHLPQTPISSLEQARETALQAGLKFVYLSRVTGHEAENTFCPECGEKVITRTGFYLDSMQIKHGRCRYCQAQIPGIWP